MKKTGRKPYGCYPDEQSVIEVIKIKRRARKGSGGPDPESEPVPTSATVIARELNAEGVHKTQTGVPWYPNMVKRILARIENAPARKQKKKCRQKKQLETRDFLTAREVELCRRVYTGPEVILFETLLRTGLRRSEICALDIPDLGIYHEKRQIDVRHGKGCKSRTIFLGPAICELLKEHLAVRCGRVLEDGRIDRKAVFLNCEGRRLTGSNLYYRIKCIARRANLEALHPHSLRHTFGTFSYNYSNNLEFVKDQLGHTNIATTVIYAKTLNDKKLKEMENLDGVFDGDKAAGYDTKPDVNLFDQD